ncbi:MULTISPECIES: hypothetical protein [Enterococcus]|nr:hypothetical protein [Enterococcus faecalis]RBS36893.1 hypothetical protein EB19_02799 [Enterococcus faecium]RBS57801.1 hypothetical protein EB33_01423 [Enterococcus faecium]
MNEVITEIVTYHFNVRTEKNDRKTLLIGLKGGKMVCLSNQSELFSEQYLIAYMEATNRKELSFYDCLFLFKKEKERRIFYSQMKDFSSLRRIDRTLGGKNKIYFVLSKK